LIPAKQLRDTLERERVRADRHGSDFAVVLFRFTERRGRRTVVARLGHLLRQRLRATDEAGFSDASRIAAIMPNTRERGAQAMAEEVCKAMGSQASALDYEVFVYPDGTAAGRGGHPELAATTSSRPAARSANELFAQPLPRWKRALDITVAFVGLVVSAPILLAAAAIIKLTSPGPVLFTQRRAGLGGKPFTIYKLRTMRRDADALKPSMRAFSEQDGPAFKMKNDPRITTVGRFLRRTCLDELPQFWNVIRGDMSLVGPRPLPLDEANRCLAWQRRRLHVTPGLTCIWQVSGGVNVPFTEWMRMDIRYINGRRPWLDVALLWQTVVAVILRRASY
jgi:lipopolysaccharide/colanic/teichoic acid biosynthesis glycosyltransferase